MLKRMVKRIIATFISILIIGTSTSLNGVTAYSAVSTSTVSSSTVSSSTVSSPTIASPTVSSSTETVTPPVTTYTDKQGVTYYIIDFNKTASVVGISKDGYSKDINIPDEVTVNGEEYSVTSISGYAFSGSGYVLSSCSSITIPSSVTDIYDGAFVNCNSLTSINVDVNNTNYASEGGVLFNKDKTELICYPEGNNQSSYAIPNDVTSIGSDAFESCSNLKNITIPSSATSIGQNAFEYCSNLISITIPSGVTSIGRNAFEYCSSLTSINVDDNNKNYSSDGKVLFNKDKTDLIRYPLGDKQSSYTIPSGVTNIGMNSFYGCSGLASITIPNSVTSIGESAFGACGGITNITIPSSVTSIGYYAFPYCSDLTSINVDDNNKNYSSEDGVLFNKDKTELICYPERNNQSAYIIPGSVISINDGAFSGCSGITSITIPSSVTSVNNNAFYSCSSLTSINVDDNNKNYSSEGGVLFNKDKTELVWYPEGNKQSLYTIPSSVKIIDNGIFSNCNNLENINTDINNINYSSEDGVLFNKDKTELIRYPKGNKQSSYSIPSSVTSIGDSAFSGCSNLTSIIIPSGVTSIGDFVFGGCSSLTSITIPSSVTCIGNTISDRCNYINSNLVDGDNEEYKSNDGVFFYSTIATGTPGNTQPSTSTVASATTSTITLPTGTTTQGSTNTQGSTETVVQDTTTSTGTSTATSTVATGTTSQTTKTGDASVLPVIAMFALGAIGMKKIGKR